MPSTHDPLLSQAHLSDVYGGQSKVNNSTPRSVATPPPWANLDPRVLSPIPDKKKREARWDDKFFRGNPLQSGTRSSERTPVPGRSGLTTSRRRPASAGVRKGDESSTAINNTGRLRGRPSSANVRGRETHNGGTRHSSGGEPNDLRYVDGATIRRPRPSGDEPGNTSGGMDSARGGFARRGNGNGGSNTFSPDEIRIITGEYQLDQKQEATYRAFVSMLVDFDTCIAFRVIDDAFREAMVATGLQDFTGCGEE